MDQVRSPAHSAQRLTSIQHENGTLHLWKAILEQLK